MLPTMNLQAVTGQLHILDGVTQQQTAVPGLLAQPAPRSVARGRERDFLFIHLALSGPPNETAALSEDLLDLISRRYYKSSGSITAALRQAILEANQQLLTFNLSGAQITREGAITCVVLRDDELFTLQVGEAQALIGRNYGVERMPPKPPNPMIPLGRTVNADIRYYHHRLQEGDTLLLLDPRLAHLETAVFYDTLIDADIDTSLRELQQTVGNDSARLMVVSFASDLPLNMPDAAHPLTRTSRILPVISQPRRDPQAAPAGGQPVPTNRPRRENEADIPAQVERTARQATAQAFFGLSWFTNFLADVLDRFRSPTTDVKEAEAAETAVGWALPALIAVVIPLVVVGVVLSVFLQRGQGQRLAEVKQEMALNLGLADQAGGEAEQRDYYTQVLILANEAETQLRAGDADVARFRSQAQSALDFLDDITRLNATPLFTFPEGARLTAVTLPTGFADSLYVLDGGSGIVYRFRLAEDGLLAADTPEPVLFPQQAVGSHIVGPLVDLLWRPQGQSVSRDGLAVLDTTGALLSYRPNFGDTLVANLGLASQWQAPVAMATYDERLYILDIQAEQIWRYFPTGDQFEVDADNEVLSFGEDPALAEATDFDIFNEDGSLVIVYRDGRIRYYDTRSLRRQWDEQTMQEINPDVSQLISPTAVHFVGRGLPSAVYVGDAGSGRILQMNTRAGQVLIQYRANNEQGEELFFQLNDFSVTEDLQTIYFITDNTLYRATE